MVDAGFGIPLLFPEIGLGARLRDVARQATPDGSTCRRKHGTSAGNEGPPYCATFFFLGAPARKTLAEAEASFALAREPVFDLVASTSSSLRHDPARGSLKQFGIEPTPRSTLPISTAPSLSCVADYPTSSLNELTVTGKRLNSTSSRASAVTSQARAASA